MSEYRSLPMAATKAKRASDDTEPEPAAKAAKASAKAVATPKQAATPKPAATVVAPVIPVGRTLNTAAGADSSVLQPPKIPVPSATPPGTSARKFVRQIIPWVLQELPNYMKNNHGTSDKAMNAREPLSIGAKDEGDNVVGYKEAWNVQNCWESLSKSGIYEGAGNATWADPEVGEDESADDPSWSWVYGYSQTGYVMIEYGEGSSARRRICFPIPLDAYWPGWLKSSDPAYPKGLKLLCAFGHLWAWYVAMWDALMKQKADRVRLLYEAALTATVKVRIDCRPESLATEYLLYSEKVREDSQQLIINFVTFADKINEIDAADVGALQKLKLRFCGALINATMMKAVQGVKAYLTPKAREMIGELGH